MKVAVVVVPGCSRPVVVPVPQIPGAARSLEGPVPPDQVNLAAVPIRVSGLSEQLSKWRSIRAAQAGSSNRVTPPRLWRNDQRGHT